MPPHAASGVGPYGNSLTDQLGLSAHVSLSIGLTILLWAKPTLNSEVAPVLATWDIRSGNRAYRAR